MQLPLTPIQRSRLRKHKIRLHDIAETAADELAVILGTTPHKARTLIALAEFQSIPSIGIRFAEDLVFLGYFRLEDLRHEDGAALTHAYEKKKGYWIDPCVEDQFRLVVHVARTRDRSMNWWDFTATRKQYRAKHGYPADRPTRAWHEVRSHQ
ncbi:MAG: helix-hairpin-helix domain-containing protein [Cyclobacteriaceae bacterium]|nr:helix-hairpin-helix domain-containing protein [Cyclobacteriaceae bacterium]